MISSYFIQNVIISIITFSIFIINVLIYKRTEGGSRAYKCWAIATFFILLDSLVSLTSSIVISSNPLKDSNINELFQLISLSFSAIGYFYIPVGMLNLSSDLGIHNINQKKILKIERIYQIIIICIFIFFFAIIFEFYSAKIIRSFFNLLLSLVWVLSFYIFYPFYKKAKEIELPWKYLLAGVIFAIIQSISANINDIGIEIFEYIRLPFVALLGFSLLLGFYKLGKDLKAF